ncbi:MAG: hypothetical protein J5I91_01565 [Bacteroidetes bacterium]|nr:hypothetical protein [Bacteroidota bacterium]
MLRYDLLWQITQHDKNSEERYGTGMTKPHSVIKLLLFTQILSAILAPLPEERGWGEVVMYRRMKSEG